MRLLDQVAQASAPLMIREPGGVRVMPGPADRAAAVRGSPLRYLLDPAVSETVRGRRHAAAVARMPAPCFWAEWFEDDGRRTGVLVHADADGLRGMMEAFWEQDGAAPDLAQATLLFDWGRSIANGAGSRTDFALAPHLHPLAPHLLFRFNAHWAQHFARGGPAASAAAVREVVGNLLPACETLVALVALLQSRAAVVEMAVDRMRLNRLRARCGKAALLDHIEVRLDPAGGRAGSGGAAQGERAPARRHGVRGHLVRRGERLFWRRAHERGLGTSAMLTRTVILRER